MRTIDITTTQKVTIQYELASLRDRFFSFMLDWLLIWTGIGLLSLVVAIITGGYGMDYLWYFIAAPIIVFYTPASEALMDGQSLGKKALGIKVVKLDGKQPIAMDYIIRWAFRLVDLYFSFGAIASILVSSTPNSQRLGGISSNTTVVKTKSSFHFSLADILNINTLEDYEPKFPEIRQFGETDMLFIKNIISRYRRYPNIAHKELIEKTVEHICLKLDIEEKLVSKDKIGFLKTLLRDYIVLTR